MIYVYIKHQVANFRNWRELYDGHRETRKRKGCLTEQLFQKFDDENDVTIVFGWDNEENAREFIQSQDLKDAMQRAGVMQKPEVRFLNQVESIDLVRHSGEEASF